MRPNPNQVQLEPIAACANSGAGAAIAIIRLSGQDVHSLTSKLLANKDLTTWRDAHLRLAKLMNPENDEVIDECLVVKFSAPRSFTGEDMVEIHCHGGPFIIETILSQLFGLGLRQANPGEFTQRAFLNGKMDLTNAEGINELVRAQSHSQWLAATQLVSGRLARRINSLRDKSLEISALLEARIDFPEEKETQAVARASISKGLKELQQMLDDLSASYDSGRIARDGLRVVLIGQPNAGKSSLFNALLDSERAIVTDVAGTTRDFIEENCTVSGELIRLVDTAGIRDSQDQVERIGIEASRAQAAKADLCIMLIPADSDDQTVADAQQLFAAISGEKLCIASKDDHSMDPGWADLAVSVKNSASLSELGARIAGVARKFTGELRERPCITNARQNAAVLSAKASLAQCREALEAELEDEIIAFELQETTRALVSIVGTIDSDALFDKIFSDFCIGK